MAGQFLYFVEGRDTMSPAEAERLGLSYAFPNGIAHVRCGTGPGSINGVVASPEADHCGYYPDSQEWRLYRFENPKIWVGWRRDKRPGPDDLRKHRDQLPGHEITMADGSTWVVPCALKIGAAGYIHRTVPSTLKLDDSGKWVSGDVLPQYRRLWEIANKWFDHWLNASQQGQSSLSAMDAVDMCCEALSVNYRVTRAECAALGLFDDQQNTLTAILGAVIDWPTYEQWRITQGEKKEEPAAA